MKTEGHILSCTDKIHDIGTDTGYYHRQRIYHIIILGFDTGKQHHHRHNLEEEGLVVTVHGKGSFIAAANQELLMEERRKELEKELEATVRKARAGGLTAKEIRESFEIIMEDEIC